MLQDNNSCPEAVLRKLFSTIGQNLSAVSNPALPDRTVAFAAGRLGHRDGLRANRLALADRQSSHGFVAGVERLDTVD
jgi:hypothetical protein